MEQQLLVINRVSEGPVFHSTVDGKDTLNREWRRERSVVFL